MTAEERERINAEAFYHIGEGRERNERAHAEWQALRRLALDARHNPGNEAIQAQLLIIL